jgi:glycosyltransferase involved in cell wall biosynthesis
LSTHILAKALKHAGHEILIISATQNKNRDHEYKVYDDIDIFFIYSAFYSKLRSIYGLYNKKVISALKNKFAEFKPDVVHAQIISSYISFYSLALARKFTKAVFFTARDTMAFTYGKYWWYINQNDKSINSNINYKVKTVDLIRQAKKAYLPGRNLLIRYWLNHNCAKILAVSQELKRAYITNGINNIEVVYNSVDTSEFDKITSEDVNGFKTKYGIQNKKIIFCAGRLSALKGLIVTIETLALVKKYIPNIVLAIAANNSFDQPIIDLIKKYKLERNILFYGWLDRTNMAMAYKAADVCNIPSIYLDPLPRINFEAMAAKKPVIGTCFGGTPEAVVDGVTGFIVNPLNVRMMMEKIINLINNTEKAKQFGLAGYKRVKEEYNPEKQARKTLEYYKKYST